MKKITLIILCSAVVASVGMAVAYYNTASLGYDSANIVEFYDGGIYVFDFDINYEKVKNEYSKFKERLPREFLSI